LYPVSRADALRINLVPLKRRSLRETLRSRMENLRDKARIGGAFP
jgi:hypothetical protein